ncbi:MAG: TolC family protein [Candidatus Fibromonas sp.]|jgi:outer membrane protein|nr:TolC family protein [Candidatus Fibromonas sp.]
MYLKLISLFMLLLAFEAFAQNYQNLTLQNCVEIAKKNSLTIASAKLSEKTAASSLEQAKNARWPDLSGRASQGVSGNPLFEDSKTRYGFSMGINSSMPVYTAGRIGHSVNRAEYQKEIAGLNSEAVARSLSEQVIRVYMQVWSLMESESSAKAALELSKRLLAKDSVLFSSGSFTASDLALAFAQVASDSLSLLQAQSSLVQNYTALRQLLEIPLNTDFTLLPPDSAKAEVTENYATLLALAQQNSIDKKMDSLSVLAAGEAIGVANAARYPSISFSGSLSTGFNWEVDNPRYQTQLKNGLGYSLSLGLSIPIIDWGAAADGVLQAQVAQERAQITAINTQKQLENAIEQLALQVETYRLQWEVSTIQMEAQKLALDKSVQQHELGMMDISSLIQQQTIFNNSQIRHNQAKYSYLLGKVLLDLQTGNF